MKELLSISSLSDEDIQTIFKKAKFFLNSKEKAYHRHPSRRICLFFLEDSTRTRLSFDIAARNLGAQTMMFATGGSSMSKGESLGDTLRILNKYQFDAYVIRTENAGAPWLFKRYTPSPIINAGDGAHEHPSQALLDAFTLLETWKEIKGKRICLLGDVIHSRVAGSNIRLLSRLGAKVILCGPGTLLPRKLPKEWEEHWGVEMEEKMEKAIEGVDAVMTWRLQKERMTHNFVPSFQDYSKAWKLTESIVERLCPEAVILHPGPANREIEIESKLLDSDRCLVLNQAKNGTYIRMAILDYLFETQEKME